MRKNSFRISVCIPAYNRVEVLPQLLDSVLSQDYANYEVVICEDNSPQRDAIREAVAVFSERFPGKINYFENTGNLGYDANIRNLIEKASGEYCFFMGNDDLMRPGALGTVASALARHKNIGVVLRSYASFDGAPENIAQTFRYFPKETFFPAGPRTISTFYRRSVVISGLVLHRTESLKYATDKFDGTLLYQLYLVANILNDMNGVSLPEILVLYRNGGVPDFGNSEKEKGLFTPKAQTQESSVYFVRGMFAIAQYVENQRGIRIYRSILNDIGNYSYPILAIQAGRNISEFVRYAYQLSKLGLWRSKYFYGYFFALLLLGSARVESIIKLIKKRCGYTPTIGNLYRGASE